MTAYFAEGEADVLAHAGRLPESLQLFQQAERLYEAAGLPVAELLAELTCSYPQLEGVCRTVSVKFVHRTYIVTVHCTKMIYEVKPADGS